MTKITSTTWKIEPHTEAKHAILRKYLDAWLPIMARWNGRILYIDGFAGPGEYTGGKCGSPIIAINAILEHKANIKSEIIMNFIEAYKVRCEYLKQKISSLKLPSNIKTECICAKFDETLAKILRYIDEQKKRLAPAFVFIDPFGFTGMPFALIKRIMENQKCEVLINFMYEEINRFIDDKKLWQGLIETFGTEEWKEVIPEKNSKKRMELLHAIYKKQLEKEAGIKFVRSFKMKNKFNKADYFLFFGTNNLLGLEKMKEAMWRVDKSGNFEFSDATNPFQAMLFNEKPNYSQLKNIIIEKYKNKAVSSKELGDFIVARTPFLRSHYKTSILREMERAKSPEIEILGGRKKKGTYPDECIIKFI